MMAKRLFSAPASGKEVEQEGLKMKMPDQDNLPGISLMLRRGTFFLLKRIIRGNT